MTDSQHAPIRWQLAQRTEQLQASFIREILKITQRPEVISFAGGLPSPDTFPIDRLGECSDRLLREQGRIALQYGPTNGYAPLREWIAHWVSTPDSKISPGQVLITSGSQQGLDLIAKVMIDEGSRVLVEKPSYLGALQAFSVFRPEFVSVPTDDEGMMPQEVERLGQNARIAYTLPNYQNPTGRRMGLTRRQAIIDACARLGLPLIEDDPYGMLCYDGEPLPRMLNMNPQGVLYLGSFSKIVTPGLRLGYVVAPAHITRRLELAKQAADLHTCQYTQMQVYETVKDGFLDQHIPMIRTLYRDQCQVMLDAMAEHFPSGCKWTRPQGGMFIWATLPKHIDTMELLERALKENVAFVPGAAFYANEPEKNTLRLSFVTVPPEKIREGIATLGKLIAAH